jgi:hypothetical protein
MTDPGRLERGRDKLNRCTGNERWRPSSRSATSGG